MNSRSGKMLITGTAWESDMAVNLQTKFVMVLEARGFKITKRGKYIVMEKENYHTKIGRPIRLYVGKSGAVRRGITQAFSHALLDSQKQMLLGEYDNLMPEGF